MLNNCLPVTASVEFALISPSLRLVIFVPPISMPLLLMVTVSPAVIVSPFTVVAFTVLAFTVVASTVVVVTVLVFTLSTVISLFKLYFTTPPAPTSAVVFVPLVKSRPLDKDTV